MHTALMATSDTLRRRLSAELQATGGGLGAMFTAGGGMEVTLNTPEEMGTNTTEGLSIWLYRMTRDDQRYNAPPVRLSERERRRPLPLRLHYLMTPIVSASTSNSPETEQLILGRVLQVLHDQPKFRGPDLSTHFEDPAHVEIRVRLEPSSLEELTRVWDALDRSYQLSASYEVSVSYVESARQERVLTEVSEVLASNAGPSGGLGIQVGASDGGAP